MAPQPPSPLVGPPPRRAARRSRVLQRLVPLVAFAAAALGAGILIGSRHEPSERRLVSRFASAWERGDYATMHSLLTADARREHPLRRFVRAYARAADTATIAEVRTSAPRVLDDGEIGVDVRLATRIFGVIAGRLALAVEEDADGTAGIAWRPEQVFPGLREGERLERETRMPARAAIQARDGTVIAQGEQRLSDLGPLASEVAGRVGPAPPEREKELARRGVPEGTPVGLTGLERTFDERLAGRPGGTLRAGARVVASSEPVAGPAVRTTIDPRVQEAAVVALAGRFGGIAVMRPSDGEVLGLAGVAYSAPQPRGST